jgi:hypothetical protein
MLGRSLRTRRRAIDRLVDEALDAYVTWREERVAVWHAYGRWSRTSGAGEPSAFMEYRRALDREEHAADTYELLVARVSERARWGV